MIKISNISVMNMDNAIRGMRNPLNSWSKSDSYFGDSGRFIIGDNDHALAKKLVNAGSDHRKFLRQILVSMDITAPRFWWTEFDTYKVGTVANSCSTMHTIHTKEFERSDFSIGSAEESPYALSTIDAVIEFLNEARRLFLETKDKGFWRHMIEILPQSYNQKRTVTLNYEVIRNMYHARKSHKLTEWHDFCEVIKALPYSEFIYE